MHQLDTYYEKVDTLVKLMHAELMNSDIRVLFGTEFKDCKHKWDPNLVMDSRHKMVQHYGRVRQAKLFSLPPEIKYVEAKKLIHKENQQKLTVEKEQKLVRRAIRHLEQSFLDRRNTMNFLLFEPKTHKVEKSVNVVGKKAIHQHENIKFTYNYSQVTKNVCGSIYCEPSLQQNRTPELRCCRTKPLRISHKDNDSKCSEDLHDGNARSSMDERRTTSLQCHSAEKEIFDEYNNYLQDSENVRNTELDSSSRVMSHRNRVDDSENIVSKSLETQFLVNDGQTRIEVFVNFVLRWHLSYYWKVWRKFVLRKKNDTEKTMRFNKIDMFLRRLTTKKLPQSKGEEEPRQNIKSTKFPLESKRAFEIQDTKKHMQLQKIDNEVKESTAETYETLQKGLKNFHVRLQPELKALSTLPRMRRKLHELHKRTYPIPGFLIRMENRCEERKRRWESIQKNKKEIEMEKIQKERELEKMQMVEKRKKLEELREERKQKKIAEEESKKERQLIKQRIKLAQDFYTRHLIKRRGFEPWRELIRIKEVQFKKAIRHSEMSTIKTFFSHWSHHVHNEIIKKYERAYDLYERILLRNTFHYLITDYNESVKRYQVAVDWWDAKLTENIFRTWFKTMLEERWQFLKKDEAANSFYLRNIKQKWFTKWKRYPELLRNEKEKEKRKRIWQRKVLEFLPDYQPSYLSEI